MVGARVELLCGSHGTNLVEVDGGREAAATNRDEGASKVDVVRRRSSHRDRDLTRVHVHVVLTLATAHKAAQTLAATSLALQRHGHPGLYACNITE